jgi:hypothetical protein
MGTTHSGQICGLTPCHTAASICDCNILVATKNNTSSCRKYKFFMRSVLFWDLMWHRMVVRYQCFETTYQSPLQGSSSLLKQSSQTASPLKTVPIGFPKTSITNYNSVLCKIPEEQRFHLHHGRSLQSHVNFSLLIRLKVYTKVYIQMKRRLQKLYAII